MRRRTATWWIDRWRESTAYRDMTLAEQGAYRNLIDELWLGDGTLPADDRILARISGAALEWPRVRESVMSHFIRAAGGWRHQTHDQIVAASRRFRKSQAEKGRKGAEARWQSPNDGHAHGRTDGQRDGPANARSDGRFDGRADGLPDPGESLRRDSPPERPLTPSARAPEPERAGAGIPTLPSLRTGPPLGQSWDPKRRAFVVTDRAAYDAARGAQ